MTTVTLPERVAARRVAEVDVRLVVLSVLAAPLFVVGWLVGGFVSAVLWCCAAVAEGFDTGRGGVGDRS